MKLRMRHSYLFSTAVLLLAAVLAIVPLSYAAPQSPQNASASSSKLRSLAEQGDAVAQYNLAQSYLRHDPTNEDYQSALKWLRASAAQGNADAEFLLGYLYEHGQGVPRDYTKGADSYRAAALQGHSTAENNLASLYQHGQGPPRLKIVWRFSTTEAWASRSITRKLPDGYGLPQSALCPPRRRTWLTCTSKGKACRSTTSLPTLGIPARSLQVTPLAPAVASSSPT